MQHSVKSNFDSKAFESGLTVAFAYRLAVGVLATLKIMGAWGSKECLLNIDPKSKISEKSDQNCGS